MDGMKTPAERLNWILGEIAKSQKRDLDMLRLGVYFERESKKDIDHLLLKTAADRFTLSKGFLGVARTMMRARTPHYRTVIGRSYYAIYHSLRAVTYVTYGGDDHQSHSKLPGKLPKDFPDREKWSNSAKQARLVRNEADYEPYPKSNASFRDKAVRVYRDAQDLRPIVEKYLAKKGVRV
jgi:uncharacterized protein (UPF0332 family)